MVRTLIQALSTIIKNILNIIKNAPYIIRTYAVASFAGNF